VGELQAEDSDNLVPLSSVHHHDVSINSTRQSKNLEATRSRAYGLLLLTRFYSVGAESPTLGLDDPSTRSAPAIYSLFSLTYEKLGFRPTLSATSLRF